MHSLKISIRKRNKQQEVFIPFASKVKSEKLISGIDVVVDAFSEMEIPLESLKHFKNTDVEVTNEFIGNPIRSQGVLNGIANSSELNRVIFVNLCDCNIRIRKGQCIGAVRRLKNVASVLT